MDILHIIYAVPEILKSIHIAVHRKAHMSNISKYISLFPLWKYFQKWCDPNDNKNGVNSCKSLSKMCGGTIEVNLENKIQAS